MPLPTQEIPIVFRGLQEKTSDVVLEAGDLTVAKNIEFDKDGQLNKRRGYLRLLTLANITPVAEYAFTRVGTYQNALVIFGVNWIYALTDKEEQVDGSWHVAHSRLHKGQLRMHHVATAQQTLQVDYAAQQ